MFSFFIKQNPIIILNSKLFHTSTVRYLNCRHPFHILKSSYLPLMLSISIYLLALGAILFFHLKGPFYIKNFIYIGLILVVLTMFFWFKRIFFEADSRYHSSLTKQGFRIGFILFILSEIMFFAAFFWAFFHSSLTPSVFIGGIWPPAGVAIFNPFSVPLFNTLILLSSGVTITYSHCLLLQNRWVSRCLIDLTIILGVLFWALQGFEYSIADFNISDSIYGSVFYLLTGFHGFHIVIGIIFLIAVRHRFTQNRIGLKDHASFEFASWYWHFVDVVWLFVYSFVYIWAGRFL